MPYKISWHVQDRIMHIELLGEVNADDMKAILEETKQMLDVGVGPVHAVTDLTGMSSMPLSLSTVVDAVRNTPHEKAGMTILVGASTLNKFFSRVISKVNKIEIITTDTLEEAWNMLERLDSSLTKVS